MILFNEYKDNKIINIAMFIINAKGKYEYFDFTKFNSDEDMYLKLWYILYGVKIEKDETSSLQDIVDFVNGDKFLI